MQLNTVLSGNTPLNWAQKRCFPKIHFRSSKLKGMAAVRHGAKGITTKNNPSGAAEWRAGWLQLELVAGSFSFYACAFGFFAPFFFPSPPLSSPFMVEGEGRGRSHQLCFGAKNINSSAQRWWGCSVGHIWGSRKSGVGPALKESHVSPVFKNTTVGTCGHTYVPFSHGFMHSLHTRL